MSDQAPSENDTPDEPSAVAAAEEAGNAAPEAAAAPEAPAAAPAPEVHAAAQPVATDVSDARPNRRKVREGVVVSAKMQETVVVSVIDKVRHPRYGKTMQRTKRLYAHNIGNDAREGDRVRVQETRPMSKLKRWRVVEVLERAR